VVFGLFRTASPVCAQELSNNAAMANSEIALELTRDMNPSNLVQRIIWRREPYGARITRRRES
jgi:hypothetical protein